jgi:hypothetical protein
MASVKRPVARDAVGQLALASQLSASQFPSAQKDTIQHFLGQFPCARILLPQLNVSTPKPASRGVEAPHDRRRREWVVDETIASRTEATSHRGQE